MPPSAPGDLSAQVLRLLERDNVWLGEQEFQVDSDGSGGIQIISGTPTSTTSKLYNVGGSLFWNGVLLGTAPAGAGTVTSVGFTGASIFVVTGSPVTTAGTIDLALATQTANTVFAGPALGGVAVPTFRALVAADIPAFGVGAITWASVSKSGSSLADLATISASVISSGTLPDGRFPATLPAASGANLTALSATQLTTGTVPAARMPAFTGDATTVAGAVAITLAASGVAAAVYGSATAIPVLTIDSKGRVTSATTASIASSLSPSVLSGGTRGGMLVANASNQYAALNPSVVGQYPRWNGTDTVWSLDGSALTGLSAAALATGVVAITVGGTGLTTVPTNGQLLIGNGSGYVQSTLTGTANQVVITNGLGTITLSLPQAIATSSTPQFARIGAGVGADAVAAIYAFGPFRHRIVANGTTGAALTLNLDQADVQSLTLGANCTLTFSAPVAGVVYRLLITQDGAGSRLITWPTIRWRGAAAPTLTITAGRTDVVTLIYDGSVYLGDYALNFG